ncbi:MAG: 5'-nucleotidase C-terminal domain-containing protein [Candidatus Melainabacteria bacterium]|nr:5'-nucleotidase C-terminal domain-containing protein [Candidatus Melainabacteria bacterium]
MTGSDTNIESSKPQPTVEAAKSSEINLVGLMGRGDPALAYQPAPIVKPVKENDPSLKQAAAEMTSSLAAGVGGTVVFSLAAAAATRNWGKALTIPMAMLAGGTIKVGTKASMEAVMLDSKDRTTSATDFAWGGVDALAGVGASAVEKVVAQKYLTSIGREALGKTVVDSLAETAGKLLAKESVSQGLKTNLLRGVVGGSSGAAIWSAPHRVSENWNEIKNDPGAGLAKSLMQVGHDTAIGAAFGGTLSGGATLIGRRSEVFGQIKNAVTPDKNVLRLDTYHINDFHSNTEQLPRIKTLLDQRMAASQAKGVDSRFVVPGDIESGRVNFAFTNGGKIENEALMKMGAKELVPGNHAYDAPGGRSDVPRYPAVMEPLLQKYPDVSLIASNLDVSAHPQYERILKPYVQREVQTPWGPQKVGTIGVTTEEGAVGGLKYIDPKETVEAAIKEMKKEGVSIFQIHSHLGLGEDIKLAQHLIAKDIKVAGIIGAHSHDALVRPVWVGAESKSGLARLNPFNYRSVSGSMPGAAPFEIPIVQAGHSGNWLGEFNQAIRPDGTAHRFLTTSKLHQVTESLAENPGIRQFLDETAGDINALKSEAYDSHAVRRYSAAGSRNKETEMGNLFADAVRFGLKEKLGDQAPQIALVHSGGIRTGIPENVPLTRLEIANIVMNAGKREGEQQELALMNLTGAQLKAAIEYGVREKVAATKPTALSRVKNLFAEQVEEHVDEPGNFVQVSGMKYSYDATKPGLKQGGLDGERISGLSVLNEQGVYEAIDLDKTYSVAARFHPLEKWWKYGIFGEKPIEQLHRELNVQPLKISQVDLIGDYIRGKTLDPSKVSPIEGRITDLTPNYSGAMLRPGKSLLVAPILSGKDRFEKSKAEQEGH